MRNSLVFYINDSPHEIGDHRAGWTLAEYLRNTCHLMATKVVCAEGDCGSCTVLVGRMQTNCDELVYQPLDSCIVFLFQLDRTHVVTVEGLMHGDQLSPVQQAMVDCHGSQCGFCTPGFVAALHGLVEQHHAQCNGEATLADEELRYGLSGNLCRCTGYSQILEAGKSISLAQVPRLAEQFDQRPLLDALRSLPAEPVHLRCNGTPEEELSEVFLPRQLAEAVRFKTEHPDAKVVAGATDIGVQRNHGKFSPRVILSLSDLVDFDAITLDEEDHLHIGAGATWSEVLANVGDRLPEVRQILRRFGSPQIRNLATIGGNIVNASPIADSLPLLYVLDAQLELIGPSGSRTVAVDQFYLGYKQLELAADELLAAIHFALPRNDERLKLYKVSKRRDLDISTATAGFWFRLDGDVIASARFAAGGVGPTVVRLPQAEAFVVGKPFDDATLREAGRVARTEVRPITDVRSDAAYRAQLVENLFAKAFFELSPELATV